MDGKSLGTKVGDSVGEQEGSGVGTVGEIVVGEMVSLGDAVGVTVVGDNEIEGADEI